jgi:serine protease Do
MPVEKLGRTTGVLIAAVAPESPASIAGVKPGDIMLSIAGKPSDARYAEQIPLVSQLTAGLPIGERVELRVLRDGKEQALQLTVGKMPPSIGKEDEVTEIGVTVEELTRQSALELDLRVKEGLLLTGIRPGYAFDSAQPKIQTWDVVTSVNGVPTPSIASLRQALKEGGEKLVVLLQRGDEQILSVAKMPEEKVVEDGGELPRPWLAVRTQVMTEDVSKALSMEGTRGFRITRVYPWTEAEKAGLRVGDIITEMNGTKLTAHRPQDAEDLRRLVEDCSIGDTVELCVRRNGTSQKVKVKLEATPRSGEQAKDIKQKELEFTVRELTDFDRLDRCWGKEQQGVLVTEVTVGGWAHIGGLKVGDLLVTVGGELITGIDSFQSILAATLKEKPKVIQFFVKRRQGTSFVFIEPDWPK